MVTTLTFDEGRQGALLIILLLLLLVAVGFYFGLFSDDAPAWIQNLLTCDLEFDARTTRLPRTTRFPRTTRNLSENRGRRELTIRQEDADETPGHEIKHLLLRITQILGNDTCWDNGVVVGYLRGVEYTLRLLQRLATDRFDEVSIGRYTTEFRLIEAIQSLWTFRIDIIAEVLRIHTGIGGVFFLIEALDEVECHLGREGILTVTVHLQ